MRGKTAEIAVVVGKEHERYYGGDVWRRMCWERPRWKPKVDEIGRRGKCSPQSCVWTMEILVPLILLDCEDEPLKYRGGPTLANPRDNLLPDLLKRHVRGE